MTAYDRSTVLVVEDDSDIRFGLEVLLKDEGYRPFTAANGRQALALLRTMSELPSLILLDLMMPDMDGWEFRAEQRRDPKLARIPIMVLSAAADLPRLTSKMGAVGVMQKPVHVEELLAHVKQLCPLPRRVGTYA